MNQCFFRCLAVGKNERVQECFLHVAGGIHNMAKCKICNCELGEVPMCFGTDSPARIMLPDSEYKQRVFENEDQCIVDNEYFFIRGHILIPVIGSNESFIWSVWVSLSKTSSNHVNERWYCEGRENDESYFGWLMTSLPVYTETQYLKANIQSQPVGYVPLIMVEENEHPLSVEQQQGITLERVHEIVHQLLH